MTRKVIRFLVAGVPAFLVAIVLNYTLVQVLGLNKPIAYALVLVVQIVINFFACRFFVFEVDPALKMRRSFAIFFNGIALFRLADWIVYSILTHFGVPFLLAQMANIAVFAVLKFEFSRRVFESPKDPGAQV